MYKDFIVYFRNEDDAQKAESALRKIRAKDLFIDTMPGENRLENYSPVIPIGSSSLNPGTNQMYPGQLGAWKDGSDLLFNRNDPKITHMLQGKVHAEDYSEAMQIMGEARGVLEKR